MAKKTEETSDTQVVEEQKVDVATSEEKTKSVKNRGYQKAELDINGETVIIYPGQSVKVPFWYSVPTGVGLIER